MTLNNNAFVIKFEVLVREVNKIINQLFVYIFLFIENINSLILRMTAR